MKTAETKLTGANRGNEDWINRISVLSVSSCSIPGGVRSGRRRIHETTIERQDASAIHRLTPRRSCEDDRDGARIPEQAHSARLR